MSAVGPKYRRIVLGRPLDLMLSLRLLRFGPHDPTFRLTPDGFCKAVHTSEGPGLLEVHRRDPVTFDAYGWGPGGPFLLHAVPDFLGFGDEDDGFVPDHPGLLKLQRSLRGLRLVKTPTVFETFVPLVFQQRVAWRDAAWSFREIVRKFADPAPGPARKPRLMALPSPRVWREIPQSFYQEKGVDARRAQTLKRAASSWRRIEETRTMSFEAAARRLEALPGIGPWTSQNTLGFGSGWADAVPLGDYDLPRLLSYALTGEPRGWDDRMLELLEPYRGQRFRVIRWIHESGVPTPRFGPRRGSGPGPGRTRRF
ncbi:MAG: DNA-3-methyladenine glycosylase family protein [Myxococcota bacterium]